MSSKTKERKQPFIISKGKDMYRSNLLKSTNLLEFDSITSIREQREVADHRTPQYSQDFPDVADPQTIPGN